MAFLRRKTVNGHTYLYLVENRRVGGKVRQTVLEYLGREHLQRTRKAKTQKTVVVIRRPSNGRRTAVHDGRSVNGPDGG